MMTIGELWHAAWSAGHEDRDRRSESGDRKDNHGPTGARYDQPASAKPQIQDSPVSGHRLAEASGVGGLRFPISLSPCHLVSVIRGAIDGVRLASLTIVGVGTCEVRLQGECAELRALFVAPDHRRQGAGEALFNEALQVAREANKRSLCWTVRKENREALGFYWSMGAHIFRDDFDDYWMAVVLDDKVNGCRGDTVKKTVSESHRQQHSTPMPESAQLTDPRPHLVTHSPIHPLSAS